MYQLASGSVVRSLAAMVAVLATLASPAALAKWAIRPSNVPVERLLDNTEDYLRKHPDDAQSYYVLGRLHSMAFAMGKDELSVASSPAPLERGLPELLPWESVIAKRRGDAPRVLTPTQLIHLEASIRDYQRAVDLWSPPAKEKSKSTDLPKAKGSVKKKEKAEADERSAARAMLGLAWMWEEAATLRDAYADGMKLPDFKKLPKDDRQPIEELFKDNKNWEFRALFAYRDIVKRMAEKDKRRGFNGPEADTLLSADAAAAIVRLLEARPTTSFDEKDEIAANKKLLAKLETIGRAVTPIIFPAKSPQPLEQLLDNTKRVDFDVAADGVSRKWPWLREDTCLLVWDPQRSGQVRDGRQLFGSATWWIFWDDGYQPLAALDNDGDGWLTGKELAGLAVWQDRNGNGRSDPGEVVPVSEFGIRRIAVHPQGREQGVLSNVRGIELANGTWLPTYDWTPASKPRVVGSK